MSKQKHTPEPWEVKRMIVTDGFRIEHHRAMIARVEPSPEPEITMDEAEANARLIGQAPKMKEALKLYVRLDNDRRAGCEITDADWAECHQLATAILRRIEGGE